MASKTGFMKYLKKKMAKGGAVEDPDGWGEIGGDPGYGQSTHRKNSTGEPHTNGEFSDEQDMEYMASGGRVGQYNEGEPDPDPDHHESNMATGPMDYSDQQGEPDPYPGYDDEQSPDLAPHHMAQDQIHPGMYADGGNVLGNEIGTAVANAREGKPFQPRDASGQQLLDDYNATHPQKKAFGGYMEYRDQRGERGGQEHHDETSPDFSSAQAMSRQAPGFSRGGKMATGARSAKGKMAHGGMMFAKALKKGMR